LLQLKQLKPLDHNSMMRLSQSSEWQPAVMEKAEKRTGRREDRGEGR
jgi:hypothetical protein